MATAPREVDKTLDELIEDRKRARASLTPPPRAVPDYVPQQIRPVLQTAADRHKVPVDELALIAKQESNFNPSAVNPESGAYGMFQQHPPAHPNFRQVPDPAYQADYAAARYAENLQRYGGDREKSTTAWFGGQGTVDQAIARGGDQWQLALPPKTGDYNRQTNALRGAVEPGTAQQNAQTSQAPSDRIYAERYIPPPPRAQTARVEQQPVDQEAVRRDVGAFIKTIEDSKAGRLRTAASSFTEAVGAGIAAIPEAFSDIRKGVQQAVTGAAPVREEQAGRKIGAAIREAFDQPVNPEYANEFWTAKVPAGFGSAVTFLAGGFAGRALAGGGAVARAAGSLLGAAPVGALTLGAQGAEEAYQAGADDATQWHAFLANAALGTSEALPIARVLNRLDKGSGGHLSRILKEGLKGSFEEALQETLQQVGTNAIAQALYDADRTLLDMGVVEGGEVGGVVGFTLSALATALGGRQRGLTQPPPGPAERATAAATADGAKPAAEAGEPPGRPGPPPAATPPTSQRPPEEAVSGEGRFGPEAPDQEPQPQAEVPPPVQAAEPAAPVKETPDVEQPGRPAAPEPAGLAQAEGEPAPGVPGEPAPAAPVTGAAAQPDAEPPAGARPGVTLTPPPPKETTDERPQGVPTEPEEGGQPQAGADAEGPAPGQPRTPDATGVLSPDDVDALIEDVDRELHGDQRPLTPPPAAQPEPELEQARAPKVPENVQRVVGARGTAVDTEYEVVPLASLVAASQDLQPRDRATDPGYEAQIHKIFNEFEAEKLGRSPEADKGSLIVGPDDIIESGNGRRRVLERVYTESPEKAAAYKAMIEKSGFSTEGIENPVLIRRRLSAMTFEKRKAWVAEANESGLAAVTGDERARMDRDALTPELLRKYNPNAELTSAANQPFISEYAKSLGADPRDFFQDGKLTQQGLARVRGGLLSKAYGGTPQSDAIVRDVVTNLDPEIGKNLADSMIQHAPQILELQARVADKMADPSVAQAGEKIATAVQYINGERLQGRNPLANLVQTDMLAGDRDSDVTAIVKAMLNDEGNAIRGKKVIGEFLSNIVENARGTERLTLGKAIERASQQLAGTYKPEGQGGLFDLPIPPTQGATAQPDTAQPPTGAGETPPVTTAGPGVGGLTPPPGATITPPTSIDTAANEAATSEQNDLPQPTDAQKEAGNYQKGHVKVQGLDISIETPKGATRTGKSEDGSTWNVVMPHHYGYIKRTEGADGEKIDVALGPDPENADKPVFVIDQGKPDGSGFDEHKVMMGFDGPDAAIDAYRKQFSGDFGTKMMRSAAGFTQMTPDQFKEWVKTADTTKPASETFVGGPRPPTDMAGAFKQTEELQRGAPEIHMTGVQKLIGGGVMSFAVEHIGDLSNRMAQVSRLPDWSHEAVMEKVEKTLRTLKHGYGFEREFNENLAANKADPVAVKAALAKYADLHEQVPIWNEPQWRARQAAIDLGRGNYAGAIEHLTWIKDNLSDYDAYVREATKYTGQPYQPGATPSAVPDLSGTRTADPANTETDVSKALESGARVFITHEQDETPVEVKSVADIRGYLPEQIYILPKGAPPTAPKQPKGGATPKPPKVTKQGIRQAEREAWTAALEMPMVIENATAEAGEFRKLAEGAIEKWIAKEIEAASGDPVRVDTLKAVNLPDEFYANLQKDALRLAKEQELARNRDPAVYDAALADHMTGSGAENDLEREAFKGGFDHALAGRTKSTLSGENLPLREKGYESGRKWIRTEEGKAWFTGKRPDKLQNTSVDLKRAMDEFRKRKKDEDDANKGELSRAWESIQDTVTRSTVFNPTLGPNATPGLQEMIKDIRNDIYGFKEYARDKVFGSRYYREDRNWDELILRYDHETGGSHVEALFKAADKYVAAVSELSKVVEGSATVADAALKLKQRYSTGVWSPGEKPKPYNEGENKAAYERLGAVTRGWYGLQDYYPGSSKVRRYQRNEMVAPETAGRRQVMRHPKLDRIERTGMPDHRKGQNVTPQQFIETFGFASVGFGKWVQTREDQDNLNYAYDSFMDLAVTLGIPPKAMSLGGKLHFTIGALGSGTAAAHFSPNHPSPEGGRVTVINVTKTKGDGTVAHEWTHAVDFALRDADKRDSERLVAADNQSKAVAVAVAALRSKPIDYDTYWTDTILTFYKGHRYWVGHKQWTKRQQAEHALTSVHYSKPPESAYFQEAKRLDKGNGDPYWSNQEELLARASEAWVFDTLNQQDGKRSTYLVNPWVADGIAKPPMYRGIPYPTGKEREHTGNIIATLFKAIEWTESGPRIAPDALAALDPKVQFDEARQRAAARIDEIIAQYEAEEEAKKLAAELAEKDRRRQVEEDKRLADEAKRKAEEERQAAESTPKQDPMGPLTKDDIDALIDDVEAGLLEAEQENPDFEGLGAAGVNAEESAPEPPAAGGITTPPSQEGVAPTTAASAVDPATEKTAAQLISEAAKLGVTGIDEALTGLAKLFGGSKLNSFPSFDEESYAAAKPHFEAALRAFQAAGKTLRDLIALFLREGGPGAKPYISRFIKDNNLDMNLGQGANPSMNVAKWVQGELAAGRTIEWTQLFEATDRYFGGTQAAGKYTPKDAYDALEVGVNLYLRDNIENTKTESGVEPAVSAIRELEALTALLPTQTKRTPEQEEFQQFSTPPAFAYAATWLANISAGEIVLEPSAGVGGLAIFAENAGANLVLNELSKRRLDLLRTAFPKARVFAENAEQLHNILPDDITPSAVLMNPPFSATAGRVPGQRDTLNGARHVDQALQRLQDGGRLVAIVGQGMSMEAPAFKDFWDKIRANYTVRANVLVDGSGYVKYGTTFDVRYLVIDKTGPTASDPITGKVGGIAELPRLLEAVRNERTGPTAPGQLSQSGAIEPGGPETPESGKPVAGGPALPQPRPPGPPSGTGSGATGTSGGGPGRPGAVGPAGGGGVAGPRGGRGGRSGTPGTTPQGETGRGGTPDAGSPDEQPVGAPRIGEAERANPDEQLTDTVFDSYRPRISVEGGQPHGAKLVESAAMASVQSPPPTYTPNIPKEIIESGAISLPQLEVVAYAGQAHEQLLPDGRRRAFLTGDGTGVGKTRELLGVIMDNWNRGRRKAVIISANKRLFAGLGDEMKAMKFRAPLQQLKGYNKIALKQGVIFTTYDTLKQDRGEAGKSNAVKSFVKKTYENAIAASRKKTLTGVVWEDIDRVTLPNGWTYEGGDMWRFGQSVVQTMNVPGDESKRMAAFMGHGNDPNDPGGGITLGRFDRLADAMRTVEKYERDLNSIIAAEGAKSGFRSRLEQVRDWLGGDQFDGVIVFDEAHAMANQSPEQGARGSGKASEKALAAGELEKALPKARLLYASATAATEVRNLSYLGRLGLWGDKTPFANAKDFVTKIVSAGVAAMEVVARDMKALGMYLARSISYDGVKYDTITHPLSGLQGEVYDATVDAWNDVRDKLLGALDTTNQGDVAALRRNANSQYYGTQQRFFNMLMMSMQMPTVIDKMREDMDAGYSPVLQLVNTGEAGKERKAAAINSDEDGVVMDEADLEYGPLDMMIEYVRNKFPAVQYEQVGVDDKGRPIMRPVTTTDADGNEVPVISKEAEAIRDALLKKLEAMKQTTAIPGNPLDLIIDAFGTEQVGEGTGRKRRFVKERAADGSYRIIEQKRGNKSVQKDLKMFMDDEKRIFIFSGAMGIGQSFHASLKEKNQRLRRHYIVQPGWQADAVMQALGRTHRTYQKQPPEYILVTTDVKAQKRFISSISRRLDQLGALSKGERKTTSQGLFKAEDNLESQYAVDANVKFWQDLHRGNLIEGLDFAVLAQQMGFDSLVDQATGNLNVRSLPLMPQYLNRMLGLKLETQNLVFDAFMTIMEQNIQRAKEAGTYDVGLETLQALETRIVTDQPIYEDERTGATTRYVKLEQTKALRVIPWQEAAEEAEAVKGKLSGFYRDTQTGRVFMLINRGRTTDARGRVISRGSRWEPVGNPRYVENAESIESGGDVRYVEREGPIFDETSELPQTALPAYYVRQWARAFNERGEEGLRDAVNADYPEHDLKRDQALLMVDHILKHTTTGMHKRKTRRYERISDVHDSVEAEQAWNEALENAPKTEKSTVHMVAGVVLPIWDKFADETTRVGRVQTVDGVRLLGRILRESELARTLKKLGVNPAAGMSPQEIMDAVMAGRVATLSNGWLLSKARVSGEERIEIKSVRGFTPGEEKSLQEWGAIKERISWAERFFVPVGNVDVMGRLMGNRPVADLTGGLYSRRAQGGPSAPQERRADLPRPPKEGGMTVEQVENELADELERISREVEVEVVQNEDASGAEYEGAMGVHWLGTDKVVLVADNLGSPAEARRILLHEVYGHLAMERYAYMDRIVQGLIDIRDNGGEGSRWIREAWKKVEATYADQDETTQAREVIAMMAEEGVEHPLLFRLIAALRDVIRAFGIKLKLSDNDLRDIIASSARRLNRGEAAIRSFSAEPEFTAKDVAAERAVYARKSPGSHADAQKTTVSALKDGVSFDVLARLPFRVLGMLNEHGELAIGVAASKKLEDYIKNKKFGNDGPFRFMNPVLERARMGLLDRYGVPRSYLEASDKALSRKRELQKAGLELSRQIEHLATSPDELQILHNMLTGEQEVTEEQFMGLPQEIRSAIDKLSMEAVSLNLISKESYERNRGTYLHRVYLNYELAQYEGLVAGWFNKFMRGRRHRIHGDELKGRGVFWEVTQDRLLRDLDTTDTDVPIRGVRMEKGKPDASFLGRKFRVLDITRRAGEGQPGLPGIEEAEQKERVVKRIYWPLETPVPAKWADAVDRGTFEIRRIDGNKYVLWRDFTKAERAQMGEILDARYTVAKTFQVLAQDISSGEFFRDVAQNPEATWQERGPPPRATIAKSGTSLAAIIGYEWVRVPTDALTGTGGKKKWGDLAGKYVRAEVWKDLKEYDRMNHSNTWEKILDQWKLNKTARNPVVHMNNFISNLLLADLIDVRWRDVYYAFHEYVNKGEIYEQAITHGALGSGFIDQEMHAHLRKVLAEISRKQRSGWFKDFAGKLEFFNQFANIVSQTAAKVGRLDEKMIEAYGASDDIFRLAAYARGLRQGLTPQEAATRARDEFLNYDIRAPWINSLRRSVLPFLAYTYRAVPVIADALMRRPWKMAKYVLLAELANVLAYAISGGDEDDERATMAESDQGRMWMGGAPYMMRLPANDEHGRALFEDVRRWVPAGDIYDMNQRMTLPIPTWMQFGGPLVILGEIGLNRAAFTGQDIVNPKTDDLGDKAAKWTQHAWRSWMPSAPWIYDSWYYDRIAKSIGGRDQLGRPYSTTQAVASSVGLKVRSVDPSLNAKYRADEYKRTLSALRGEVTQARRMHARGLMSRSEFDETKAEIVEKIEALNAKRSEVFGN